MRIVSPLLKKVLYPALATTGVFRRTHASGLAVVTYHGVLPPGYAAIDTAFDGNLLRADVLRQQLHLLKGSYNVISPDEFLDWRENGHELPAKAVLVTCDDGLLNCLSDMVPVLQQENIKCLFFVTGASATDIRKMLWYEELFLLFLKVPAGSFDVSYDGITIQGTFDGREQRRAIWWDFVKRLSQVNATRRTSLIHSLRDHFGLDADAALGDPSSAWCRRYGLLTSSELCQLVSAGMSVGAHTLSHPMLSQLPPELAYEEVAGSRARLESALNARVWAFAYPFGNPQSVTSQTLAMPRLSGYQAAFLNYGGGLGSELAPYSLPRIHVTDAMSLSEFEAHVSGFYARLQRGAARNVAAEMAQS
jgi:peptidoglycan/xylan/chitin deacetylase (PgdA/CDA1 family)